MAIDMEGWTSYTADLLGDIASKLEDLHGFDTLALELLQNADDSEAETLCFDIQEKGLEVSNSSEFSYCNDHNAPVCPNSKQSKPCDFHNIKKFASRGKSNDSKNIGRFGIGFASVYQITDHPSITSTGICLQMFPEDEGAKVSAIGNTIGTKIFLPWAMDPQSNGRQGLQRSHITKEHIKQLQDDFKSVLKEGLLFLKYIKKVELKKNSKSILSVIVDRIENNDTIKVSFTPDNKIEKWFICKSEVKSELISEAFKRYPRLQQGKRKTKVSIAIRISSKLPEKNGLLYAFLPTRQLSGLPLHINADFFPQSNRKTIIFDDNQHAQKWNELLINAAAEAISSNLEALKGQIDYKQIWEIVSKSYKVKLEAGKQHSGTPKCFSFFWENIKRAVENGAKIVYSSEGKYEKISTIYASPTKFNDKEIGACNKALKLPLVHNDLYRYNNILRDIGVIDLNLRGLASDLIDADNPFEWPNLKNNLKKFYQPIWSVIDTLISENTDTDALNVLDDIPFLVNTDNSANISINKLYTAIESTTNNKLKKAFSFLDFAHESITKYKYITDRIAKFTFENAISEIEVNILTSKDAEALLHQDDLSIQSFYSLLIDLDNCEYDDNSRRLIKASTLKDGQYKKLIRLPIWKSGSEYLALNEIQLPGDFEDPIGEAKIFNRLCLTAKIEEFLESKLDAKRLTIDEYARSVVPKVFNSESSGVEDNQAYKSLIKIFAKNNHILDDESTAKLLKSSYLIPNTSGTWSKPDDLYFKKDKLVELLGDSPKYWINKALLPKEKSVITFIKDLGVLSEAKWEHLIERIDDFSENNEPTKKVKEVCEKVFYRLCALYKENKYPEDFFENNHIRLPIMGDKKDWYETNEIYTSLNFEAFSSQANVLEFKDITNKDIDLLKELSINTEPSIDMVLNHLSYCIENRLPAHKQIYQTLSQMLEGGFAASHNPYISRVKSYMEHTESIYVSDKVGYVRPNQVFYNNPSLGEYAFTLPIALKKHKTLFSVIGIKDDPKLKDYIDILEKNMSEKYIKGGSISVTDKKIYQLCLEKIHECLNENYELIREKLSGFKSVLNCRDELCFVDEVLIDDSVWYRDYFDKESWSVWLANLDADEERIFKRIGIERLSEVTNLELFEVENEKKDQSIIVQNLRKRCDLLAAIIREHSIGTNVKNFYALIDGLIIVSCSRLEVVAKIKAKSSSLDISSDNIQPSSYFEKSNKKLYLLRPVANDDYIDVFTPIIKTYFPKMKNAEAIAICSLCDLILGKTVDSGTKYLKRLDIDLDINQADASNNIDSVDTSSEVIEDIGGGEANDEPVVSSAIGHVDVKNPVKEGTSNNTRNNTLVNATNPTKGTNALRPDKPKPDSKSNKRKEQDKRLLSYVKPKSQDEDNDENHRLDNETKLRIESASRVLVNKYENKRGRNTNQMAQQHEGYDIESIDEETGELRYIEVKGTTGEWKDMGVSLSKRQHYEAQDRTNSFWLYVVEYATNSKKAKVYAIQDPATKIGKFMFDGGWKSEAEEADENDKSMYREGVRINHDGFGDGEIQKVEYRGIRTFLTVKFDYEEGNKNFELNTSTTKVLDE